MTRSARAAVAITAILAFAAIANSTKAQEAEVERYTPATRGVRPAVAQWAELVEEYDWPVNGALRVIQCESGGDPLATNPSSGAKGLFQLLGWDHLAARLFGSWNVFDPRVNVAVAYYLWRDSGGLFMIHWGSSRACWWW